MKTMNTTRICKHLRVTLKHSALAVAVAAGLGSAQAVTPRSFTGTAITENFDGLTSTGTDVTVLTGWDAGYFLPIGTVNQSTTGGNSISTATDVLVVNDGGAGTSTPILGNLGTTGSSDRALGSFARTNPKGDQFLQVAIKNDSGSPITTFELTYTGEEWRSSNATVQQLTVWYSATDASSGFVSMGSGFTFNSPNNSGSNIAIDGNATGNRTVITGMFTPATPIADGSTVYIRWYDINDLNISDDYLAIDDLSFGLPVPDANILTFGPGATIGALSGNAAAITWYVQGTSAAALSPTFTLSDGATCTVAGIPAVSGETRDFTSPVVYRVEASDYATSGNFTEYTVTVVLIPVETTVLWDLNGGGTWDTSSPNWKGQSSGSTTIFTQGNNVVFDKTAGGTITITPGMEPLTTTVSAISGTYTFGGGPLAGSGSLTKDGNGNLTINIANNTYSGGTIINAGQLTMGDQANAALGTGPVTLNGGLLYLARISAANALIVNGGKLHTDGGWGCYWNGPVTLNADLNIEVPGYDAFAINGSISGAGGIILNDGDRGPVRLYAANSYTGPTSVTACTLECNNIDALGSGALSISSTIDSKVTLNYTGEHNVASLTLGGMPQASGTYGSTASGADHQNNTYFGGTGKVRVPASSFCNMLTFSFGALGAGTIGDTTITLEVPFGTDRSNLAPTYTVAPGATCSPDSGTSLNFTSTQSYTVTAEDGIATKTYDVTVTEAVLADVFTWTTAVTGDWSDSSKWTNELATGSAPLAGGRASYTLNFTTAGTYTATNNMNAGFELNQLNLGSTVTLAGNGLAFVTNDATLPTINQNSGSTVTIQNDVALGSETTFGGSGNGQVNLSGSLTGDGMLTKNSSGTLTLAGDFNTYSGGTTINAGSLNMGDSANNLLGTGPVIVNSPATLNLNGNGNLTNAFTFNGAKVTNGNSFNAGLNGPVTLEATTTFDLFTTGNMSIGGIVSGPGGITKLGTSSGPLILSGVNAYTGPTTVAAGTLKCDNMDALGSGALSISTGATVNLNYTGDHVVASLTLAGTLMPPGTYGSSDPSLLITGTGTVTVLPAAYITAFGTNVLGSGAVISPVVANTATIAWTVPYGTDVTTLAPEFTLSFGATCDPVSGSTQNFTLPVDYTVTSSDSLITNVYTVTVTVRPPFIAPPPPPVTSGMAVWLTADNVNIDDPAQIRFAGAETFVKQWNDLSGNSNNATQTTDGDQPKYIDSGVGGRPVLRFNDGSSKMTLADLSAQFGAPLPDPYPTATNSGSGGASIDGTYINTPTRGVTGALVGDSDTAASFNGSNQNVRIPWSAALNPATAGLSDPFTVEAWVKSNGAPTGNHVIIQSMRQPGQLGTVNDIPNDRSGWFLREVGTNLVFGVGTATGAPFYYYYTVAGVVSATNWQHVVVVYDGDETPVIYVDKVAQAYVVTRQDGLAFNEGEEAAIRVRQNTDCPEIIGDRAFGGWVFNGGIDEVAIYPSALSAAAIEAHFDNGVAAEPATPYATLVGSSSPVGYYRLDEPAAPPATQAATGFIVTTIDNDDAYTLVKANPGVDEWWRFNGDGRSYPGFFRGNRLESYCAMPNSGSHLFAISSSPSAWEMSINGISQGVANANYNPGGALVIGNGSSGAGLKGDIAEVILYNRVLTAAEANQVGAYLENKYGLDTAYVSGGYGTWAGANAGGQTPGENYDNDGVANGIEYFMGATGSSFTANPGLDGTNTVTWPKSATFSGSWQVQTSPDLSTWTNVAGTDNGSSVSYTLPPGEGKKFVRLLVTPTP